MQNFGCALIGNVDFGLQGISRIFSSVMEATAENIQVLVTYLNQTLSPNYDVRKPAEDYLMSVEKQAGYSILLLQLADSEQVEMPVRLAAAINFKNFVKRSWRIVDDDNKVGDGQGRGWGIRSPTSL